MGNDLIIRGDRGGGALRRLPAIGRNVPHDTAPAARLFGDLKK
ncbi:hypothetical protein [Burkholderia sp. IMCC1007]|nr:hypothetical protein [Burkholderia sp. IMCC1007]